MAEWSIAAVLKTVEAQASGGSNPSLSATLKSPQIRTDKRIAGFFRVKTDLMRLLIALRLLVNALIWELVLFGGVFFVRGAGCAERN